MARLFAAIPLTDEARAAAAGTVAALRSARLDGRPERIEKLHLTLAFFGSVPEAREPEFVQALQRAAHACPPFRVRLDRLGGFPDERRPRLIVLGSSNRQPGYDALMGRVREAFAGLWSQSHDDDVPHVTVWRMRRPMRGMPPIGAVSALEMPVDEIVLYESLPDGDTTRYEVRSIAPLAQAPPAAR